MDKPVSLSDDDDQPENIADWITEGWSLQKMAAGASDGASPPADEHRPLVLPPHRSDSSSSGSHEPKRKPPPPPPRHPAMRRDQSQYASLVSQSHGRIHVPKRPPIAEPEPAGVLSPDMTSPSPGEEIPFRPAPWVQTAFGTGEFDIGVTHAGAISGFEGASPAEHPLFQMQSSLAGDDGFSPDNVQLPNREESPEEEEEEDGEASEDDVLQATHSMATEELEKRGLNKRRACVRRRLSSGALSIVEEEPEAYFLDYTPIVSRRPIDTRNQLRCIAMGRKIKLFIVITLFNETGDELVGTLSGIAGGLEAIYDLCGFTWHDVLVVCVQDGREKMHKSMERTLFNLRLWDRRMLLAEYRGLAVTCHLFERTISLPRSRTNRAYYDPLQVAFAAKEKNGGKLNSHLWAFSAFARQVQPEFLLLMDVGTFPREYAIARMIAAMQENPQVAGVCGEIAVRKANMFSFVEASQAFEYCIQHVLDKSWESICVSEACLLLAQRVTVSVCCRGSSEFSQEHSAPTVGRPCEGSR
jgi:hypothetical protein